MVIIVGVRDIDQDTYITVEETDDDDVLRFYANNNQLMNINGNINIFTNTNINSNLNLLSNTNIIQIQIYYPILIYLEILRRKSFKYISKLR